MPFRGRLEALVLVVSGMSLTAQNSPIPTVWNDSELAEWPAPIAELNVRPGLFTQREYYAVIGDNFRTYPVYHPDREPAGYWQKLKRLKPEKLVDPSKIHSQSEWIAAGKRAWDELDTPSFRSSDPELIAKARSRKVLSNIPLQPDGTVFALRWVVTNRGLQISYLECASCHTRFMPDGSRLAGAPENGAIENTGGIGAAMFNQELLQYFKGDSLSIANYKTFAVPWVRPDIHERIKYMSAAELNGLFGTAVSGTFPRINGSPYYITKIPDLIGIKDRKYIDHTATHRHRGPADLMRYAAPVQGVDSLDFGPHRFFRNEQRRILFRYDDAVLYALAEFIYTLQPPPNPYKSDPRASGGQKIFEREGCATCHTPPLYTSNKLTLASGYTPPADHPYREDILPVSVGTDPGLALKTRKGTGLYKIPSLRGVWYRGLYLHDGSVSSLEEMFDASRLLPDHVPGGWKGPGVEKRSIPGHPFGLRLTSTDKEALIAFLRTL